MEIFVFPEIMYSLLLANIMSPRIWKWLTDPWFDGIEKLNPYKRIQRLRQYIMDNYSFNLDLDTWGLTTKEEQLARFQDFIDPEILRRSNALFGYEGDKYYFDIDIRRHFGLDKYTSDAIPYWKTETVEAMDAFRFKTGYQTGAGECVSLACLWAAALFIVCHIPLEDIFMMATPLHSQNFVIARDGILTNNRRIVTRNMWVNGTELSIKARRALENEQVTIVSHLSGHIHVMYPEATIDSGQYKRLTQNLLEFLHFNLDQEILYNFLRANLDLRKCFQFVHNRNNKPCYIPMEKLFAYEHTSAYSIFGPARKKLLDEIDCEEFHCSPLPGRILYNQVEEFIQQNKIAPDNIADLEKLRQYIDGSCLNVHEVLEDLRNFCITIPQLPQFEGKEPQHYQTALKLDRSMLREEMIAYLEKMRPLNPLAEYAFYAYRDLNRTEAQPFLKAALERNPVAINGFGDLPLAEVIRIIHGYINQSIYDEDGRLAQPDEVYNYRHGDGVEKALLLANVLHSRGSREIKIHIARSEVILEAADCQESFVTSKNLQPDTWEL